MNNNGNVSLAVNVSPKEDTVWLSAARIAPLFDVSVDNIYLHIRNIVDDGELPMSISEDSSVMPSYKRTFSTPGSNGRDYQADYYNLDVILTVGYPSGAGSPRKFHIGRFRIQINIHHQTKWKHQCFKEKEVKENII